MSLTESQARKLLLETIEELRQELSEADWDKGRIASETLKILDNWDFAEDSYIPDDKLTSRIKEYNKWCKIKDNENPGQLMEEIALLTFRCLRGWDNIESYQSYAPQHDLVISGSKGFWLLLMDYLHLPRNGRTFVVEAKNLESKVTDKQISRLGSIIQNKFESTCHLGIFFTRKGATGFTYRRALRDARATQVLFHARTKKFIVILEHKDLQQLLKKGGLPKILEAKIRDVESASNLQLDFNDNWGKVNLPPHLAQHM
jgi:hypothetical protein